MCINFYDLLNSVGKGGFWEVYEKSRRQSGPHFRDFCTQLVVWVY